MSFKVFIYYCALCGGWAAFFTWAVAAAVGWTTTESIFLKASLIGGLLGMFVAAAVGLLDAILNSTGSQRVLRTFLCAGLGLLSGVFGGVVGETLHHFLSVPLLVGWVLVGVLVGASIGAYDLMLAFSSGRDFKQALKKTFNGIYGGFLGGFLGGLPFTLLDTQIADRILPSIPRSSLASCLVILGLCIGLMIGLAQVILKEAWIKVEEGFRPGRELMLNKDETTIGRAESCDLGLFGDNAIQKLHARILLKNNRYVLSHAADEGETWVNDEEVGDKLVPLRSGDRIRLGRSVLRFGERQKRK
jgi:hypothetical protein